MAVNRPVGDNARVGAVKNRSQTYNLKTKKIVKRDTITGKFIDDKSNSLKYKGIRKEK